MAARAAALRIRRWVAGWGQPAGFGWRVVISAVATVVLVLVIVSSHASARPEAPGGPPWPAPGPAQIAAGVHAAGLTLLAAPGDVVRYAVHLEVIVDGRPVTVPAGIGIDYRGHLIAALYTSGASGIVHLESDSGRSVFTLGQFFHEWQVPLTAHHLGGLRASQRDPVVVYLNGSRLAGPPGSVVLAPHQEIVVTYRPGPVPIPASYVFPGGM
jgi:hypothetical protein